ncbi:SDR family NAD(P)-dependent oxidoreductase [Georgenia sp. MJ170]|uniref:SDR family NAD(P)-dependent oxidoreductase n=1 Tax=Georgenia sunbinii TaxID=3117728 RepID=UPI002F26BFA3
MARRGTALITGATAGLGLELAWQLAADHHDLVLVARDQTRLATVAAQLRAVAAVHVEVLAADLSVPDDVARIADRLTDPRRPVGLLVNNAGFGLGQRFVGGELATEEDALAVMVRAVMVLSHAATGAMVARGRGAVLNVSSVAALTTMGSYAAHKAWVRVFTEGLATELRGTGVTATALCPGLVRTEFHARARMRSEVWPDWVWLDAGGVAAAALRAVRRGDVLCTPSLRYAAGAALLRLAPRSMVRVMTGRVRSLPDPSVTATGVVESARPLDRSPRGCRT